MQITADYLLGRQYRFSPEFFGRQDVPDFRCVAYDPVQQKIRVHATDGGKWWIPVKYFKKALQAGAIEDV